MERLSGITVDELQGALRGFEEHRPMLRLVAAVIYKEGPSVPAIAEWLDVREATVYGWFDRIEEEPLAEAIRDRPRPGRPARLTAAERAAFFEELRHSPTSVGYDEESWTPELARAHLAAEYEVEYSTRHVYRLLDEAGAR